MIINIPMMTWSDPISSASEYHAVWYNQAIESWSKKNCVPYVDAASGFVSVNPRLFVLSDHDHHFNDAGHRVIAEQLALLLSSQLDDDSAPKKCDAKFSSEH